MKSDTALNTIVLHRLHRISHYTVISPNLQQEMGLVSGSTFGANIDCTRAMTMEYMWKAAGSPAASYNGKFNDIPASADYAQAVAWAVENNITSGTGGSNFSPAATCTRGQIVAFLHRAMEK